MGREKSDEEISHMFRLPGVTANYTVKVTTICMECSHSPSSEQKTKDFINGNEWICEKRERVRNFVTGGEIQKVHYCKDKNKDGNCNEFTLRS